MYKVNRVKKNCCSSLSDNARYCLGGLAKILHVPMDAVLELTVRKLVKEEGVE
jgi:hypothetical protein